MSKYCSTCNKNYEDYLRYCPVCMGDLTYLYDRQYILDDYKRELDKTLESLSEIDGELYFLKEKLEKANNQDAIIDLKFKITILNEKKTPMENKVNDILKKINTEKRLKKEILKEIENKENLYMRLYVEIDEAKLNRLNDDKKFINKSKYDIIDYIIKNYSENEVNNFLANLNSYQNEMNLFYKELYVNIDDEILSGLCDYFSISFTSKEEVLKKIFNQYSKNAILTALESVQEDIQIETVRKEFYDKLMRTFTPTDVSLFCRKFDIENPSKHKIIDYLVDNFTEDEVDLMKIELYREYKMKQEKGDFLEKLDSTLTAEEVEYLANELNLDNHNRNQTLNYLVENFSENEIHSKLKNKFRFECEKILNSLKEFNGDNLSDDLKNHALDWYNKGKNRNHDYIDFYRDVNKLLKRELSCRDTSNLNVQMKKITLQFEFNRDIGVVSKNTGISESKIYEWYMEGKSGNLVFKSFYGELHSIMPTFESIVRKKVKSQNTPFKKPPEVKYYSNKEPDSDDDLLFVMDRVLEAIRRGKSRYEASELANIEPSKISRWYNQGRDKRSANTIYFYNELRKIENEKSSLTTDTYSVIQRNKQKRNKDSSSRIRNANVNSGNSSGSKLVHPSDIRGHARKSSSDDKFVHPSNLTHTDQTGHEKENKIKDNSKVKRTTVNSRKDMQDIISLMKKGYTRKKAAEELGIDYDLVGEWYESGLKNRERSTRNFFKQVKEIESKNRQKQQANPIKKSKQKNNSSVKPFKPVRSLPNKVPTNVDSHKYDATVGENPVLNDMKKVLSYMRKGNNRIQASRKSNVNIGQVNTWYGQGSKKHDHDTIFFYNEVKKIESKKI